MPQIVFKPDWTRHAKAAPFKRNDQILAVLPIGVIVFPGSGISANLADKARKLGIPVWKFGDEPALVKAGRRMSAATFGRAPGGLASSRPQAADLGTSVIGIPIGQQIGYRRWAPRWWWRRIQPTLSSRRMR